MGALEDWKVEQDTMHHFDPERSMPEHLVVESESAFWIDSSVTGNPSRIGALINVPAKAMEFYLQEIPGGEATDLQRHMHESVHFVIDGAGYSEIGPQTVTWKQGACVYTPPWVWHRHYNSGDTPVRMLLIENSGLLKHLRLNRRESAGLIPYADRPQG
jgi:mannose-6-phosphate isomerase-like protein (cupin superfamily)